MWVLSLGQEDSLEKEMKTHSSISCLESSMDREAWWATPHGVAKSHTEHVCTHICKLSPSSKSQEYSVYNNTIIYITRLPWWLSW